MKQERKREGHTELGGPSTAWLPSWAERTISMQRERRRQGRKPEGGITLPHAEASPRSATAPGRRGHRGFFPRALRGSVALPTPRFWTSNVQTIERTNSCCFKSSSFVVVRYDSSKKLTQRAVTTIKRQRSSYWMRNSLEAVCKRRIFNKDTDGSNANNGEERSTQTPASLRLPCPR